MVTNFVTVATFANSIEANLAKQMLQAGGIRCYLANEMTVDTVWYWTIAVGWIRLQVPQADVELAWSILGETDLNVPDAEDQIDEDIEKISWADETADRAFRSAVLGLGFLPLYFYSLWLLVRLLISRRRLSQNRIIKVIFAVFFNWPCFFPIWRIFD